MRAKRWFLLLLCTLAVIFVVVAGLNYFVDPFGIFGDKTLDWYGYDMTNNPRIAKIAYLDAHNEEYDSYIIGCSLTSSFPVESLNEYFDASFYNLFVYGSDLYDVEQMARYVVNNYTVKTLIVNIGLADAVAYNYESDPIVNSLHAKVDNSSLPKFYAKYLFVTPKFSLHKLIDHAHDSYLPQSFDVFNSASGSYNKALRDIESIGDLDDYLKNNPVFEDFKGSQLHLNAETASLASIAAIRDLCQDEDVQFILFVSPLYRQITHDYAPEDLARWWQELADITDFWDFSLSSLSDDPRYFYDNYHFRNALGRMSLAAMFQDESLWYPEDLAFHVTSENAAQRGQIFYSQPLENSLDNTARVPILTYHHLAEQGDGGATISEDGFSRQIKAIHEAGYTTVGFDDLIDYVYHGVELPEKCVVITFDDGYLSNYELAWPLLEQYGMQATIFAIGWAMGADTYKDSDQPIIPHFSNEQAQEMIASGSISIQSHSYDAHQSEQYESMPRHGITRLPNETEADYLEFLQTDIAASRDALAQIGEEMRVFSFPYGEITAESSVLLAENGVLATVSTNEHSNTLVMGLPQSLLALGRFSMNDSISNEDLLALLAQ